MFGFLRNTSPWVLRKTAARPVDDTRRFTPLRPYTPPTVDVTGIGGHPVRRAMAPIEGAVLIANPLTGGQAINSQGGAGKQGFIGFYANPLTDDKNKVGMQSQGI